jgi:trimeric autotransporter adhesin
MTTRKYSSRAQQTTLSASITSTTATTMVVVSGASLMGGKTPAVGETYTVVINPDTAQEEIVDVSNYTSGNTLTIARGIDGPTPGTGNTHSAGAVVRHMIIGRDLNEANTHIENTTTAHGITLANIVQTGTTGTVDSAMILDGTIVNADINASAGISDTKLNTISTALKVANSATTATSTNTASAIVARDGSGDFTAGTITADLTGNASTATTATTATALATPRAISLTGDITATGVNFDGTGAIALTTAYNPGSIVDADVDASAGIAYSKLSLNSSITSADIVDGTIVDGDIANGTISAAKLVADPYARANHTGTQLASTVSDFDTQVRTSRLDQMAAPTASVALNAQKITGLGTPTANTTDAATTAYVDTEIANLVNSAPGTLDTLGEIATAIQAGGSVFDAMVLKAGSTMTGALVLNADPALNLGAATKQYVDAVAGSATAAAASAAAAATSYDSFDDRYLGAYASDPTLDNDGDALVTGAIYFNTVSGGMLVWSGTAWGSISSTAAIFRFKFIAVGGETSLSGADASAQTLSYLAGKEQVYLNGVLLVRGTDYTATTGSSITALAALATSDIVEIITFTSFSVVTDIPQSIVDAKGDLIVGTAADTVGRLAVGTNGQVLTADSTAGTGLAYTTPISASSTTTFTNKTVSLTSNTVSGTLAEFNTALSGDDFVSLTGTETLTNKTLTAPKVNLAFNAQTGTTYTLVAADSGKLVTSSNAASVIVTIPPSVFAAGEQINIQSIGAGITSLAQGAGVTITSTGATSSAPALRAQFSAATIICTASNVFTVIGDIS